MPAGGAIIGALRVVIGADSAALTKGLKTAESGFKSFAKNITTIAAGIKFEQILTSAVRGITGAIKDSVFAADEMGKMAQKVGMPVEEFSKLAYAAKLADVPLETLKTSLIFLSKEMAEAAVEGTPAAKLMKQIGLEAEITKGVLKPLGGMFLEVVDKIDGYTEGMGRNAIQAKLLGKASADLVPLIDGGAASIKRAGQELERFGGVITTEMFTASQNFKDNMDRMGTIADGIARQVSGPLAEALSLLSDQLVKSAKESDIWQQVGTTLGRVVLWASAQFQKLTATIEAAGKAIQAFKNMTKEALGPALMKALNEEGEAFKKIEADYTKAKETFQKEITSPWKPLRDDLKETNRQLGEAFKQWLKIKPPIVDTGNAAGGAAKQLSAAEQALKDLHEEGKRTTESLRTPMEQYEETVKGLDAQLKATAISAETYARGVNKAKNEMLKTNPVIQIFENALSSALDRAIDGTGTLIEQLKALGRDLAKAFAQAAFKALLFQSSSATAAPGLLASLIGGQTLGLQHGGSFRVGGSGPADSQLVAFRATPGERVDVRTPGQQRDMQAKVDVSAPVRIVNAFDAVDFLSKALGEAGGEKVILNYVRANPSAFRAALS